MRSRYAPAEEIKHILAVLTPENRLACEISLLTGLRINDVLALKPVQVRKKRFSVREEKTGKVKAVRLPDDIVARCLACSGQHYVFEHRIDGRKHRTRQAVFKDLKRISAIIGEKKALSPHSMRKAYAVNAYHESGGNIKKVQKLLNHDSEAVTYIYALADVMTKRRAFKKK